MRKIYKLEKNERVVVENGNVYIFNPKEWVNTIFKRYNKDNKVSGLSYPNGRTIVWYNDNAKCASSKCNPNDKFDAKKGVAIAYARLKGISIPPEVLI